MEKFYDVMWQVKVNGKTAWEKAYIHTDNAFAGLNDAKAAQCELGGEIVRELYTIKRTVTKYDNGYML